MFDVVRLKCGTHLSLTDLEDAGLSYVPCGQVDGEDQPLLSYAHLWNTRRQVKLSNYGKAANAWSLRSMNGVQIMTGKSTYKPDRSSPDGYCYLLDVDIEVRLIEKYPEVFEQIVAVYRDACEGVPCEVETKSGGRRLSAFVAGYDPKVFFKDTDGVEGEKTMLLEFFSIYGLSRLDSRYKMLSGSILDIPYLSKDAVRESHRLISSVGVENKQNFSSANANVVERSQIGDLDIHWREDGRSQYFPASHCQATSHGDSGRSTVQFFKMNGGVLGRCYNCSETWWEIKQKTKRSAPIRLSQIADYIPESAPLETVRKLNHEGVSKWLRDTSPSTPDYQDPVKPILQRMMRKERIPLKNRWHREGFGWWNCAKGSWFSMRKIVRDRIKRNRFMLVMTGGAGGGKSTAVREHLKNFADVSPTTAQADEKYDDALRLGRNTMRHRSRNYNRELADNYTPERVPLGLDAELGCVPCAFPDICNNLSQIGGSPVSEFCKPHCPRFEECKDYGYLSQWRIFKDYSEIYLSYQDDIFSDPIHAGYIEQMCGSKKDFVLCLDEADPASLPPERGYVIDRLKSAAEDYAGFESGAFLKALLRETSTATTPLDWTTAVKSVLDMYDNDALNEIDAQLRGIPVSVEFEQVETVEYDLNGRAMYFTLAHITYGDKKQTCAVLRDDIDDGVYQMCTKTDYTSISEGIVPVDGYTPGVLYDKFLYLDTFCGIGFGNLKTVDDVLKLPRRYRNLTADLRAFIDTVNSDTPAVKKNTVRVEIDGKKQEVIVGWTFYLRPDMNARRGILISASGGFDEIPQLYSHTDIIISHLTTPPAEWEPGNKVFQLSTGRYTPKSALFITEKGEIVGITDRCKSFLSAIHTEVSQNPHRSLVVAPKALTAEGELAELDEVKALCELEHVDVTNHWHAEGTNRYTGVENIFILHYEPSVDEIQSIATRIYRDETLSFEREIVDLEKAGVKLQGVYRYTDPRVQAVFDRECEKRLYQTLMRGRQMLETGVDCYVFLFSAEPISGLPITPIFFELGDLVKCQEEHGTLRKLEEYLDSKAEMSVEELAELDGKSVWTTYKRTAEHRKQAKADKDAELLWKAEQLLHKGASQRGVAATLGISLGKLQSLLKTDK